MNKVSAGRIELHTNVGDSIPFHCTAAGKSILAFNDRESIKEILGSKKLKNIQIIQLVIMKNFTLTWKKLEIISILLILLNIMNIFHV